MNVSLRFLGMGFRQGMQWTIAAREAEIALMSKQRGIMNRMVDSNARLMSAGYNKLIEEWKAKQGAMKEKLRFVIASLTDSEKRFTMMAYNAMKQRALMLAGVGMGDAEMKKCQLIKRLTNTGYNLQVMAVNGLKEFLTFARIADEEARAQYERNQKEKERILKRIMNVNARFMGMGFRQALQWTVAARDAEITLMAKQRGIMRRMVDSNARLMSAGYNKLLEEWKNKQGAMKEKLKFVIAALTDTDKKFTMMAYNAMKQRMLMLSGVGMGDAQMKKAQLIKRLTNKGYNLQVMAVNGLKEFLTFARIADEEARAQYERDQKEKERILKRIMNVNARFMGMGFRQALQWTVASREAEIALMAKQRGIMNRMVDSNARLMSAGYNKLIEEWKAKQGAMKEKLRFVIASLTDSEKRFTMMAYNAMKQRALMLAGVGMGDAEMKKCQLIKRLTNTGYNLQVMAVNGLKEFLTFARIADEEARAQYERNQKEKDRILRRIMNSNLRFIGMAFRQALEHTVAAREAEITLMAKQRGIMRRMVDSNARLMSAGYNKLLEEWKNKQGAMKEKLKFVIAALTDSEKRFTLMAYNAMKQRALMLAGVGMGDAEMKKCQLIKRLTNTGYNLQVMAINGLKEFLTFARIADEEARAQFERNQKEKDRILKRIMNVSLRFLGMGFRQALQHTVAARDAEQVFVNKCRGIMRRMTDSSTRLMSAGYNKLVEEYKAKNNAMKERLRFVIAALTDTDKQYTMMAYNAMKQRALMLAGVGMGNAGMKKISLIKRLTNQAHNFQVMAVNSLREFLKDGRINDESARLEYERQQAEKERILKRIMDSNLRFAGIGFRQAQQFTKSEIEKERQLIFKQRGIMRKIVDSGTRLCGMAMNNFKEHLKACRIEDEANANLCNMRSNMMGGLIKGREGHEKRQMKDGYDLLFKNNKMVNLKQMVCKKIIRNVLGKNDALMSHALTHLRENHVVKRTFDKCRSLFRALEISDFCIDYTYRVYYRLMVNFKAHNPWLKKIVGKITRNATIDPQVSFWRLKDYKEVNNVLSAKKAVKVRRMAEVIGRHFTMQIARSFWKVDTFLEDHPPDTSFYYAAQKIDQRGIGSFTDFNRSDIMSTRVPPTGMKNKPNLVHSNMSRPSSRTESRKDLTVNYDDVSLRTPKVEKINARQTTPRGKYTENKKPPIRR